MSHALKIGLKVLARRKFFTFASLFGVSLTLLVLLVAAAFFDQVFGARAPEVHARRTLGLYFLRMEGPQSARIGFPGYGFLDRWARDLPGVERASFFTLPASVASYHEGRKVTSYLKRTDADFWRILRFDFLEGGPFTAADDRAGNAVAVINETTRRRFFGGAPAVGRTIEADGQRFRVVGVVRDVPILRLVPFADVWVPLRTAKTSAYRREFVGDFMGILLARGRADFPAIKAAFEQRLRQAEQDLPDPGTFNRLSGGADTPFEAVARALFDNTLRQSHAGRLRGTLFLLMVLFMLLPTLNLVNINLSRILERSSEIGVRKAFGASRWRLAGQFLVENVVLTLLGAGIGLLLGAAVLAAIDASGLIPYSELEINFRVLAAALAMALFFGLLSGVYPAWRMSRLHPVEALRGRSL